MAELRGAEEEEELDGEVWSRLPEDIVVSVLARLPLRELARYRAVCRKWKAMWSSPSFLQARRPHNSPAEKSWFIFNRQERVSFLQGGGTRHHRSNKQQQQQPESPCLCYNLGVNRWHALTFSNLPSAVDRVAATAGGLLFCVKKPNVIRMRIAVVFWSWPVMIVCNPLREKCYTLLPGRHCNWKPHTVGMVVDAKSSSFKIVLATVHQGTEIYDSRLKVWKLLEFCRPPGLSLHPEAVSHRGCIYSVGVGLMFVFDVEKEVWSLFDLPHPEREIRNTHLYECEGSLLLVGCLRSGHAGDDDARMLVWDLVGGNSGHGGGAWRELSSVSAREVSTVFRPETEKNGGQNDLLFVRGLGINSGAEGGGGHPSSAADGELEEVSQEHAYLYSISHDKWYLVDESPAYSQRLTKYQGEGLRFEPNIEASV